MAADQATELDGTIGRRVGTTIKGKYRLERVLGVGGMAAVYRAASRWNREGQLGSYSLTTIGLVSGFSSPTVYARSSSSVVAFVFGGLCSRLLMLEG